MNYKFDMKKTHDEDKLVLISKDILASIMQENKNFKTKITDLEDIVGSLSRKWQLQKENNKKLKTLLYCALVVFYIKMINICVWNDN